MAHKSSNDETELCSTVTETQIHFNSKKTASNKNFRDFRPSQIQNFLQNAFKASKKKTDSGVFSSYKKLKFDGKNRKAKKIDDILMELMNRCKADLLLVETEEKTKDLIKLSEDLMTELVEYLGVPRPPRESKQVLDVFLYNLTDKMASLMQKIMQASQLVQQNGSQSTFDSMMIRGHSSKEFSLKNIEKCCDTSNSLKTPKPVIAKKQENVVVNTALAGAEQKPDSVKPKAPSNRTAKSTVAVETNSNKQLDQPKEKSIKTPPIAKPRRNSILKASTPVNNPHEKLSIFKAPLIELSPVVATEIPMPIKINLRVQKLPDISIDKTAVENSTEPLFDAFEGLFIQPQTSPVESEIQSGTSNNSIRHSPDETQTQSKENVSQDVAEVSNEMNTTAASQESAEPNPNENSQSDGICDDPKILTEIEGIKQKIEGINERLDICCDESQSTQKCDEKVGTNIQRPFIFMAPFVGEVKNIDEVLDQSDEGAEGDFDGVWDYYELTSNAGGYGTDDDIKIAEILKEDRLEEDKKFVEKSDKKSVFDQQPPKATISRRSLSQSILEKAMKFGVPVGLENAHLRNTGKSIENVTSSHITKSPAEIPKQTQKNLKATPSGFQEISDIDEISLDLDANITNIFDEMFDESYSQAHQIPEKYMSVKLYEKCAQPGVIPIEVQSEESSNILGVRQLSVQDLIKMHENGKQSESSIRMAVSELETPNQDKVFSMKRLSVTQLKEFFDSNTKKLQNYTKTFQEINDSTIVGTKIYGVKHHEGPETEIVVKVNDNTLDLDDFITTKIMNETCSDQEYSDEDNFDENYLHPLWKPRSP